MGLCCEAAMVRKKEKEVVAVRSIGRLIFICVSIPVNVSHSP